MDVKIIFCAHIDDIMEFLSQMLSIEFSYFTYLDYLIHIYIKNNKLPTVYFSYQWLLVCFQPRFARNQRKSQ